MSRKTQSFGHKGEERVCPACERTYVMEHSRQKYCSYECGTRGMISHFTQMQARSGPNWERYRTAMARYIGATLDLPEAAKTDRKAARRG